jgi:hypothetical protein
MKTLSWTDILCLLLLCGFLVFETIEYMAYGDDMRCSMFSPCQTGQK